MGFIIGLDIGTTSVRSAVYDVQTGRTEIIKQKTVEQFYPEPAWVEEDAEEIFLSVRLCLDEAFDYLDGKEVIAIALTNMRETVVCWDSVSGKPLYNAIIWQCRRTKDFCDSLSEEDKDYILDKTGLVSDAYFSASKMRWLMNNSEKVKNAAKENRLMFGTVDSFVIYRLTGGKSFVTDVTNASRTMLFDIKTLRYDERLLKIFGIEKDFLPAVLDNDEIFGEVEIGGRKIPIASDMGDQQAALFGQGCFETGSAKITYGTGLFMLFNTGAIPTKSNSGLLTTIAYRIKGKTVYALEGSVFNAGTSIQWLRDNLGVITEAKESESLARSVKSTEGVCFVPAFTGLGAPYWQPDATGMITGITRGSTKAHIVRAALESMAFSARELLEIMQKESGVTLGSIRADGGASENGFLMEFEASQLGMEVVVPAQKEATVFGAIRCALTTLGISEVCSGEKNNVYYPGEKDDVSYEKYLAAEKKCIS